MVVCKVVLFCEQGWLGLEYVVVVVDIFVEDGECSFVVLFVGFDCECLLVVIIEGLVNYFQCLVIEVFWSCLVIEFKCFFQGIYLIDFYFDFCEYLCYWQICWGVGIIGWLMWGSYLLYYCNVVEIEVVFVCCGFVFILVFDLQCEGVVLGLLQGCLLSLVWVIESCMVQLFFR